MLGNLTEKIEEELESPDCWDEIDLLPTPC